MSNLKKVETKDLKKGVTYFLNAEHCEYSGTLVIYIRTLKESGRKGWVLMGVKDNNHRQVLVHKNSWVYEDIGDEGSL